MYCVVVVVVVLVVVYLSIYLPTYLSIYLQAWKRSYSARLPQFSNLTTSKPKQFCETSFKDCKLVECRADGLVPMRFAIGPFHLSKVLRLPRKSEARSYEVLGLSRKIILANLKISCSKMQPLSGNLRPDPLTHLTHVSLVLRLPRDMHLSRSSSHVPHLPLFLKLLQNPHVFAHFWQGAQSLVPDMQNGIQTSKSAPYPSVFALLTSKCALCHNGVHFFDIWTSKSAPRPSVFNTFEVEMCFAPQQRALFRHVNFQKWSENGVLYPFWLGNALRAATVYTFSTSQLPKVVGTWGVFFVFTCKCVSRRNSVQFVISHLASGLRTRRFSEPTFRPSGATNHWNNAVFRDFPTFSRTWIFFLLTVSSLILFLLLFSSLRTVSSLILLLLLFSSLLCSSLLCSALLFSSLLLLFPSLLFICPYCRKFDF